MKIRNGFVSNSSSSSFIIRNKSNINLTLSAEEYIFGDEDGTLIGRIFDYILRDGGESENFKWIFYRYYR
jgi:hypothetical protein